MIDFKKYTEFVDAVTSEESKYGGHFQDRLLSNTLAFMVYLFKSEGSTCFLKFDGGNFWIISG